MGQARATWIVGPTARLTGRLILALTLLVGGVATWHLTSALEGQTDDLSRHVRVDIWSAQQAQDDLHRFLLALARHVAGERDVGFATVRQRLRTARSAIDLLDQSQPGDALRLLSQVDQITPAATAALGRVEARLAGRRSMRGEAQVMSAIDGDLAPTLEALRQLSIDLAHVRMELQDRDLANVRWLIGLNRSLLIVFFGISGFYILLILGEAYAAKRAELQARGSEERFRDFAGIASDWLWETGPDHRFTYVSGQAAEATGIPTHAHLGRTTLDLAVQPDAQPGMQHYLEATAAQRAFRDVLLQIGGSDEPRTVRISGKPFFDRRERFQGFRGVGTDITDEVRREQRIRFLAEHDQLTRLPNRAFFQERLRASLHLARRTDRQIVLHAIDLDRFKEINDSYGHDVGDALLVAVGDRLRDVLRGGDTLARLGGDEFAIIQISVADTITDASTLAARAIDALAAPIRACGKELVIATSIGIAVYPGDGATVEDLMKAADLALYSAKARGRGTFQFFDADMTAKLRHKKQLETELRQAIAGDGLELHFQPQASLVDGHLIGAEALVRWHHAELGRIPPGVFVPIAEETGLILSLGRWVMETACREASGWRGAAAEAVVAVNVSPAQFLLQDLIGDVAVVLERTGLPAHRLELEVTEGLLMRDEQAAIATLGRLHRMGVRLAIDDFGTGYSSLSYLKRFPVHKIKIDQSFVGDLEHDEDDRVIVRAIVGLGQALGMTTIAEGVETEGQQALLRAMGCDEIQGYLLGAAMPADQFRRLALSGAAATADPLIATLAAPNAA